MAVGANHHGVRGAEGRGGVLPGRRSQPGRLVQGQSTPSSVRSLNHLILILKSSPPFTGFQPEHKMNIIIYKV